MKKFVFFIISLALGIWFVSISCKKNDIKKSEPVIHSHVLSRKPKDFSKIPFDSTLINPFFIKYPKLKRFQSEVKTLYKKYQYHYVWYDNQGINEVGNLLYNKLNNIEKEGVHAKLPYKNQLDTLFQTGGDYQKPDVDAELLISAMYFFYANKVYKGLDVKKTMELGWHLPRKKQSYVNYLDTLLLKPSLIDKNTREVMGQYYRLREVLQKYRDLEKNVKWDSIVMNSRVKSLKPGDSSKTIAQIRQYLFAMGDISSNSKSNLYDYALVVGVLKFKKRNSFASDNTITPDHIANMNIPISQFIKTIIVNMERCRWISNDFVKIKEFVVINIPAYLLTYFKDGKPELRSKVVIGKTVNKTVIFSADMKYIVFSPYWVVPKSIYRKEIAPAMVKNPNYMEEHDMEWHDGDVRQRPGPKNPLGLIKFLFPNSNSIYLHDTPSKSLFDKEKRAFSHGCIRIEKPRELANLILKYDKKWTPEKIDEAMNSGVESWYTLKHKIPVYIGYFTAWVDNEGTLHFYDDIYNRDERLASMLMEE